MRNIWLLLPLLCLGIVGCQPGSQPQPVAQSDDQSHDHAHAHGHSHDVAGPHGGHLVELGDEEFHAEWLHDDASGLVTVYILDSNAAADVPIPAGHITIDVQIGDSSNQHQLAAVDPTAETGTAHFELHDKSLVEALKIAGQGTQAQISVEIESKTYTGQFDHAGH